MCFLTRSALLSTYGHPAPKNQHCLWTINHPHHKLVDVAVALFIIYFTDQWSPVSRFQLLKTMNLLIFMTIHSTIVPISQSKKKACTWSFLHGSKACAKYSGQRSAAMCQRESTSPELQQLRVWLYICLTIRKTAANQWFVSFSTSQNQFQFTSGNLHHTQTTDKTI